MSSRIPIVDQNDQILTHKNRSERAEGDIYRVTGIWVTNARSEVLIARRAFDKAHDPGKWGPSAAGTVEERETYAGNAEKEVIEELGVQGELVSGPKIFVEGRRHFFCQWFFLQVPDDAVFTLQEEEVAEVRWINPGELRVWHAASPEDFIPSMPDCLGALP